MVLEGHLNQSSNSLIIYENSFVNSQGQGANITITTASTGDTDLVIEDSVLDVQNTSIFFNNALHSPDTLLTFISGGNVNFFNKNSSGSMTNANVWFRITKRT